MISDYRNIGITELSRQKVELLFSDFVLNISVPHLNNYLLIIYLKWIKREKYSKYHIYCEEKTQV